jgi:hypothetical protein
VDGESTRCHPYLTPSRGVGPVEVCWCHILKSKRESAVSIGYQSGVDDISWLGVPKAVVDLIDRMNDTLGESGIWPAVLGL